MSYLTKTYIQYIANKCRFVKSSWITLINIDTHTHQYQLAHIKLGGTRQSNAISALDRYMTSNSREIDIYKHTHGIYKHTFMYIHVQILYNTHTHTYIYPYKHTTITRKLLSPSTSKADESASKILSQQV